MRIKNLFAIFLIVLLNIVYIENIYAATLPNCPARYEENPFTDEECLDADDLSWQQGTKTGYRLNAETGEFELTGQDYSAVPNNNVYYGVSNDKKSLYAYVPNYSQKIQTMRDTINGLGILTTATCGSTLRVTKTVVGVEYGGPETIIPDPEQEPCTIVDGKYYGEVGEEVDRATYEKECKPSTPDTTPTTTAPSRGPVTPQTEAPGQDQVINTPDTASTASVVSIAFGTVAIAGGGYALMRKFDIPIKIGKDK